MKRDILGKRLLAVASLLGALALAPTVQAVEVAGVKLDDSVRVANQELKLNGAGVRFKVVFKVYAAGLYLAEKKSTVADVLAAPGAKRVTLVMMRDLSNEELGQSFMAGIKKNSTLAERTKIVTQMMQFGEMFATVPELKKGDVIGVDWIPGAGTVSTHNGKKISEPLPDVAFYNALLKIWLGDNPADAQLKLNLLGEKFAGH
ncbi:MAG TPA: chalcone isomerase family protein [Burkholderiaceae bacterium]|nr:chalcone isomerase family protein [Burkholderiaceae bacterium]